MRKCGRFGGSNLWDTGYLSYAFGSQSSSNMANLQLSIDTFERNTFVRGCVSCWDGETVPVLFVLN